MRLTFSIKCPVCGEKEKISKHSRWGACPKFECRVCGCWWEIRSWILKDGKRG